MLFGKQFDIYMMFTAKFVLEIGRKSDKITIKHIEAYAQFSAQSKLLDCQHIFYCPFGFSEHINIGCVLSS